MTMASESPFLTPDNPYDARVERTFAFIDLSGFTHFTAEHGDGEAVKVLARFRTAVREVSARKGVRIAKWLGDGAMLVSTERESLVEAIVDIEHLISEHVSPLPLRAGIASGLVIMFEGDDYVGAAVNLAARLCSLAAPGEVIAPASIVTSMMVNTRAQPLGPRAVNGLSEPVELVRLEWGDGESV